MLWLSGRFWDRTPGIRYSRADWSLEPGETTARVRLDRLGLQVGDKLAYLFDFVDEWRVRLRLAEIRPASAGPCPPILDSRGDAPPQYG